MELKVTNLTLPEKVTFNYEEMKQSLQEKVAQYATLVYTDEQMKEAKKDKAELNKFKKAMNDERVRLEKAWMRPFDEFKSQVRELISIVDDAVESIDTQVKEYEKKQKEDKLTKIRDYWNSIEKEGLEWLDFERIYVEKWLNASVSMKSIQEEINTKLVQIANDLATLAKLPEYGFEAAEVYKTTLDISKAVSEASRMSEIAKKKAEQEAKEREAQEKAIASAVEEQASASDEVEELTEIEEDEQPRPWLEPCIIPESGSWVTFKACMTMDDKLDFIEWMKSRNIPYEVEG